MRVVLSVVVLWLPADFFAELVLADEAPPPWWVFTLVVSAPLARLVLRSVWTPSDDAVRDDNVATRLSTQLSRTLEPDDGEASEPPITDRTPPRRWWTPARSRLPQGVRRAHPRLRS